MSFRSILSRLPHPIRAVAEAHERASILILGALASVIIIGSAGLAVDVARLYSARAELSRAVDAASLAAVPAISTPSAYQTVVAGFMQANEPSATVTIRADVANTNLSVDAKKDVRMYFMSLFGFNKQTVSAHSKAGSGGNQPLDSFLAIDTTGSMHGSCTSSAETNSGCKIYEAKQGALSFVSILLSAPAPSGNVLIGQTAFRGCYNPPLANPPVATPTPGTVTPTRTPTPKPGTPTATPTRTPTPTLTPTPDYSTNNPCIRDTPAPTPQVTYLTSNATTLNTAINAIHAIGGTGEATGGSGTNICETLKKGQSVLFGAGHHTASNTLRFLVVLTDGDNVYNAAKVYQASPQSPMSPCQPTNPTVSDGDVSSGCRSAANTTQAQKVDSLSYSMAQTLKADPNNVEIYVIGLSPCAHDTSLCDTSKIGTSLSDASRNENLMKCIASSSSGTNDHYYYVTTATSLNSVFQSIAGRIINRLIE